MRSTYMSAREQVSSRVRISLGWLRGAVARLVLLAIAAVFLFPLYWMLATAVKTDAELAHFPPLLWPAHWEWGNFLAAARYVPLFLYMKNTLVITIWTVIGAVVSNAIVAYGFSGIDWPGRDKVFGLVLATIFIPFPVLLVPLFDIFAHLGWVNTYLPLIVPAYFGNAFWIFLLRQFLLQIPAELSDAARIDGAGELRIFWQIVLPLAKPAIATVAIFAALGAWNDFLGPLIYLQDNSKYTLSIGLAFFRSEHNLRLNLLMAASTVVVTPVILLFLSCQRYFVEGITLGSVR